MKKWLNNEKHAIKQMKIWHGDQDEQIMKTQEILTIEREGYRVRPWNFPHKTLSFRKSTKTQNKTQRT